MINVFQPSTDDEELRALKEVLDTHWLGKGKKVAEFEEKWAEHSGTDKINIVSANTCTSALFEAVRLAGISGGDEIIIPDNHFIGTAQAVMARGGVPVFCDIDPLTLNASDETIKEKISSRTKAVILNHYGGIPCADQFSFPENIIVIRDLANDPCANLKNIRVDFATWSFDAMKIITMGSGGMLYCKDPNLAERARTDFNLGMDSKSGFSSDKERGWWKFGIEYYGMRNEILNDMQAAIGLEQLKKLPQFVARRKAIVRTYRDELKDLNQIKLPTEDVDPYYFFWITVDEDKRDDLALFLRINNIYTTFRYYPLSLAYYHIRNSPVAYKIAQTNLLLPLHQGLSDDDVQYVVSILNLFFG